MTEREQFEAWYAQDDQKFSGDSVRMTAEFVASLREGGGYVGGAHSALNKAWRAWQARAGIVPRPEDLAPRFDVTPALIGQLRERTGCGIIEARRVLESCGGDVAAAERALRLRGT